MKKLIISILLLCSWQIVFAESETEIDLSKYQDLDLILSKTNAFSIEQYTGRLLFNPDIVEIYEKPNKKTFVLNALVVDQNKGIELVDEVPMSCYLVESDELLDEIYKGYRQNSTLRYIRDVKSFPVTKAMLCKSISKKVADWQKSLKLEQEELSFVFEEYTSSKGQKFYYYLNADGVFEVYM